jgi:hypothetical protein
MQKWMNENGTINLEELFTATLHILDDDEDPWVKNPCRSGTRTFYFIKVIVTDW